MYGKETIRPLQGMFTDVSPCYDMLNRLITFRLDVVWRSRAVRQILALRPGRVLDLCCGSGDLALILGEKGGDGLTVIGADFSLPMLEKARIKASRKRLRHINFIMGDAAALPFGDTSFDSVGIAFAFRNLTYRNPQTEAYLRELVRIIRPGGSCVIVESSQPKNIIIRSIYHLYVRIVVPFAGLLSPDRGAYRYLSSSMKNFYNPDELSDLLRSAGFSDVHYRRFLFGAAALHIARK